jgi:hypothetical protein
MGQRIVLTYQFTGDVIVDMNSGKVVEALLNAYDYGDPIMAEDFVTDGSWDWELG